MSDEIPTITEEEYAQHAEEQYQEMVEQVNNTANHPVAARAFMSESGFDTDAAEIAFWRSKLCTDEGGDNL